MSAVNLFRWEARAHGLVLVALMAVWSLALVYSTILIDPARDLSAALRLAQDGQWPLLGPEIGGRFHLGPLWFWLLGGLLWLLDHFVLLALAVGLLGALKFPLAWLCARELGDARLGLIWAAILALPGWHSIAQFGIGHTVPLEASLLWMTLCALRYRRMGRPGSLICCGIAWSLAVHCHPSAAIGALVPLAALCLRARDQGRFPFAAVALGMLVAALPFLPLLFAESAPVASGRPFTLVLGELPARFAALWAGLTWGATRIAAESLLYPLPGAGRWPWLALLILIAAALGWLRLRPPWRRCALLTVGLLGVATLWLLLLRDRTPPYMTYMLWPPLALLLALGLRALNRGPWVAAGVGAAGLVMATALTGAVALQAWDGVVPVPPGRLSDIADTDRRLEPASVLPVWAAEANARRWCDGGTNRLTLHGDLAALTDMNLALATQRRCRGRDRLVIAGARGHAHEFAVPAALFPSASGAEVERLGNLLRVRDFTVHHPRRGWTPPDGSVYPPHPRRGAPRKVLEKRFSSPAESYLAVVEVLPWSAPAGEPEVRVNGQWVKPVASSRYTRIYPCQRCAWLAANWAVRVPVSDGRRVELITFAWPAETDQPTR